ncbi:hypothetical protein EVAR_61074_1 [Eumeta japonica]|uniref:Uncharacterized protein n=1 Tax=Eumeta variegata TaxID=151549 RepID=A0A4C1Z7M0_EUMVA|nr:hypothetical protein EVAR_61074_1 [Eumeta japonica]
MSVACTKLSTQSTPPRNGCSIRIIVKRIFLMFSMSYLFSDTADVSLFHCFDFPDLKTSARCARTDDRVQSRSEERPEGKKGKRDHAPPRGPSLTPCRYLCSLFRMWGSFAVPSGGGRGRDGILKNNIQASCSCKSQENMSSSTKPGPADCNVITNGVRRAPSASPLPGLHQICFCISK